MKSGLQKTNQHDQNIVFRYSYSCDVLTDTYLILANYVIKCFIFDFNFFFMSFYFF